MIVFVNWDTDNEIVPELPDIVDVPDNIVPDDIGGWLTDEFGYCHFGWAAIQ